MKAKIKRLCHCHKCGYDWMQSKPSKGRPNNCANPKCRSRVWDKPKKVKKAA